jgi:hypothetical protein
MPPPIRKVLFENFKVFNHSNEMFDHIKNMFGVRFRVVTFQCTQMQITKEILTSFPLPSLS